MLVMFPVDVQASTRLGLVGSATLFSTSFTSHDPTLVFIAEGTNTQKLASVLSAKLRDKMSRNKYQTLVVTAFLFDRLPYSLSNYD